MNRKQRKATGGLVYSTAHGTMCPGCSRPLAQCTCRNEKHTGGGDGIVRVSRSTKGRRGKGVTVITGLGLPPGKLADLARSLKQQCGSGGTVKGGVIEIQGEHRDRLVALLQAQGWTVKRAGG